MSLVKIIDVILELGANLILTDETVENGIVVQLLPNPPRNDAWMNAEIVCIDAHRFLGDCEAVEALIPKRLRYQRVESKLVGFHLYGVIIRRAFLIEEIVPEAIEEMQEDVTKLVQQHEPEIV